MSILQARHDYRLVMAALFSVLLMTERDAWACGLAWTVPQDHFEGVDPAGHVSYWERIGEVDCGDGLKLPLQINFNSGRDAGPPSPYLGQGWLLPLLESKFVQAADDRFYMMQPDGLNNLFLRANPNGNMLNGSAGWKGEMTGDVFTAWAPCGWKIAFTKGHITSMTTPTGRQIAWVYEAGHVIELREASYTLLKVEYNADNQVQGFALTGGQHVSLAQDKKPRVQTLAGQNVIDGVDNSLSALVFSDGRKRRYEFGADDNVQPTLLVSDDTNEMEGMAITRKIRAIGWNSATRLVTRDNNWTYQITPPSNPNDSAAIERKSINGVHQYWRHEASIGQEMTVLSTGERRTTNWFVSGRLAGHPRLQVQEFPGQPKLIKRWDYDERAQLLRIVGPKDNLTLYNRDKDGYLESVVASNGALVLRAQKFDNLHRLIQDDVTGQATKTYSYKNADGTWNYWITNLLNRINPLLKETAQKIARVETLPGNKGASYLLMDESGKRLAFVDPSGNIEQPSKIGGQDATLINGKLGSTWKYYADGRRKEQQYFADDGKTLTKRVVFQYPDLHMLKVITQYPQTQEQTETSIFLNDLGVATGQSTQTTKALNPPL